MSAYRENGEKSEEMSAAHMVDRPWWTAYGRGEECHHE